jgi:hypothetical protein
VIAALGQCIKHVTYDTKVYYTKFEDVNAIDIICKFNIKTRYLLIELLSEYGTLQ